MREGDGQAAGIALAVVATVVASGGNLYSQSLFARGVAVVPATAFAMGYAALAILAWCAVTGVPFAFDARPPYVLSLAYLSLFGSVVAFVSFLTLLRRIGAGRSGYTAAVIPVTAMLASTLFEGYRWSAGGPGRDGARARGDGARAPREGAGHARPGGLTARHRASAPTAGCAGSSS